MTDPIRDLDDLELGMTPLPADEVRRRGDRRRRRTAVLATVAAGVAVAAVVVPVAVLAGGGDDAGPRVPDPADPPSSAVEAATTAIPSDLPVALDQQDFTGDGGEVLGPSPDAPGIGEPDLCGTSVWTAEPIERLASTVTGPEFADNREVRTYASAAEAVAEMSALRAALVTCPEEPNDGGTEFHTTYDDTTGYETLTYSDTIDYGLGGVLYQFVRVGNAVLATSTYGEYGQEIDRGTVRERTALATRIVGSLCVFTQKGCD